MTIFGHMKTINISTLKSKASETLRNVRNGESYIVMDRDIPVAEIIPFHERKKLTIHASKTNLVIPRTSFDFVKDPLDYLLEDRNRK